MFLLQEKYHAWQIIGEGGLHPRPPVPTALKEIMLWGKEMVSSHQPNQVNLDILLSFLQNWHEILIKITVNSHDRRTKMKLTF